jgi:serine/threonine-protein kinase HipA
MTEIEAYIYGHKIGTLIHHNGTIYFEYDEAFKSLGLEISPIKLHTQKTIKAYTNQDNISTYKGIAGVFFDSLPDKHGMTFIDRYFERQELKPQQITLLHKLAFIGDRGMGAIEYRPKEHENINNTDINSILNAKEAYEEMKKNIINKEASITDLMNILDSVSPVGGGRPKMLVLYNEADNTIKLNTQKLQKGYKRAIIKFDEVYYENESIGLTKLEYIFMQMAKEAGINTANFKLIEENGMHHLVVERFDRDEEDNKLHICTASGLMHIDISVAQVASYENLFTLTRILCNSQEDIEELFKRMVFNVLALNYDDHTKNFSFIMNKQGIWSLSPAYDITYSKGMATQHLTTIGGKSKDFRMDDLLKIAKLHSIKNSKALEIINKTIEIIKTFEDRAKEINLEKSIIKECKENIEYQISLLLGSPK